MGWIALGSVGCSVKIDQIFRMKEGSGVEVKLVTLDGSEVAPSRMAFEGGTVMRITTSATMLDDLNGTVDGDVQILDLLFAVPKFFFLFADAGRICVVLDDPPGGGTFTYEVLAQQATFDVLVNTRALLTNRFFAPFVQDGAFKFPFNLHSTLPLMLVDALGVFTGTGSLEVTQPIDAYYTVPYMPNINNPSHVVPLKIHVSGEVTLDSTKTFPVTPAVTSCLDYLRT